MSGTIRDQLNFLILLESAHTSQQQKQALLQTINRYQLKALSEIAHNILAGNTPLSTVQTAKLRRHRRALRVLGSKRAGYNQKKEVLSVPLVNLILSQTLDFILHLFNDDDPATVYNGDG